MANVNQNTQYTNTDGSKYTLDANGNKIPVSGDGFDGTRKTLEPVTISSKPRLSPKIGGSPIGGFGENFTGHGIRIQQGGDIDKLDSVKSLFKNANLRPSVSVDSPFLANNYIDGIANSYNDSTYDISTIELIKWSKRHNNKAIELEDLDFIFLKNLGVYTNNRLIIARRFPFGIYDDLTNNANKNTTPVAKLISWVKDGDNFIDIDFSEKWTSSEASFIDILNGVGQDLTTNISKMDNVGKWGDALASGGGLVPLAGFTEVFQYNVLNKLSGKKESTVDYTTLPQGNPNLIRESMRREVASSGKDSFSGLKGEFKVSMKVEYEQKYVFGIDPAFAYYSIIANALSFGTSVSSFNFTGNFGDQLKTFVDKISSGDGDKLISALVDFVKAIVGALSEMANLLISFKDDLLKGKVDLHSIGHQILNTISKGIGSIINKYKVKIIGVINSLTGAPSGPWHITIGNPKHPIFSSGDMIAKSVKLTLGNTLSFNDLPASLTLDIDFVSARNLGGQEIFQKLNCGKERTYAVAAGYQNGIDFLTTNANILAEKAKIEADKIMAANKEKENKLTKDSNTDKNTIVNIVDSINAKIKDFGITYIKSSISTVDEGNAVLSWINTQSSTRLSDKITWIKAGTDDKGTELASKYFTKDFSFKNIF